MRQLQLVFDHWFVGDEVNGFTSTSNYTPQALRARYMGVFDDVMVLGRCRDAPPGSLMHAAGRDRVRLLVTTRRGGPLGAMRSVRLLAREIVRGRSNATLLIVMPGMLGVIAAIVARAIRRPYAVEMVGDPREALKAAGISAPVSGLMGAITRWALGNADAASYVTDRVLQRRYPAKRARMVANYSDVQLNTPSIRRPNDRPQFGEQFPLRLISVTSLAQPYKGIDHLLEAFMHLQEQGHKLTLTVVGGGRLLKRYADIASASEHAGSIVFSGHVYGASEVRNYLDNSDLYVHPSLTEGLPRAVIEAMATGLPCVATNVGGVPDLIDGEWLCDPADPRGLALLIEKAIHNPEQVQDQGRRNLEKAGRFTSDLLIPRRNSFYGFIASNVTKEGRHAQLRG